MILRFVSMILSFDFYGDFSLKERLFSCDIDVMDVFLGMIKNIFDESVTNDVIGRISTLTADSKAIWGSMSVGQMLAHCTVTYEMIFEDKHARPPAAIRLMLKWFVKPTVVGEKPYKRNSQTAPAFKMTEEKDFEISKNKLIDYLQKVQNLGPSYFEGRESHSFGKLTIAEWNAMFYKHLDYHLSQFGV